MQQRQYGLHILRLELGGGASPSRQCRPSMHAAPHVHRRQRIAHQSLYIRLNNCASPAATFTATGLSPDVTGTYWWCGAVAPTYCTFVFLSLRSIIWSHLRSAAFSLFPFTIPRHTTIPRTRFTIKIQQNKHLGGTLDAGFRARNSP